MVSQSSSVGYHNHGEDCWLDSCPKDDHDTLHKEGKTQKVIAKKRRAVHRALCQSTLIERRREGKDVVEKKCTSNRDNRTLERIVKQNPFKMWGDSQEWTASWSQCFKNHYAQTYARHGFSCPHSLCQATLEQQTQRQKRLAWAKDKKDWTAAEWSKVMFSDESKFCISFGNQGPRVWRKRGEAQNPCCLRSSVKFPQSVMVWGAMSSAGVGPLCFLRSKVNTAVYRKF